MISFWTSLVQGMLSMPPMRGTRVFEFLVMKVAGSARPVVVNRLDRMFFVKTFINGGISSITDVWF